MHYKVDSPPSLARKYSLSLGCNLRTWKYTTDSHFSDPRYVFKYDTIGDINSVLSAMIASKISSPDRVIMHCERVKIKTQSVLRRADLHAFTTQG